MNGARYAYLSRICELVEHGKDIVVVSNDYAAPVFDKFRHDYPNRFISVGIAEQNQMAVSCGLALAGKRVVAYGCAPFPITRAFDQIKSAISMMNVPINIVIAGIGFAIPEWGATHYNVEDIALMRAIPNMRIITPTDNIISRAAADYALVNTSPVYVRFDKYCEGEIYADRKVDFSKGFEVLHEGDDVAVLSCGSFTLRILDCAKMWIAAGVSAKVIDVYGLPFDPDMLRKEVGGLPVLTVEELILHGGLGSIVQEMLHINPICKLGIDFKDGYPQTSGSREYYIKKYGLSNDAIFSAAKSLTKQERV